MQEDREAASPSHPLRDWAGGALAPIAHLLAPVTVGCVHQLPTDVETQHPPSDRILVRDNARPRFAAAGLGQLEDLLAAAVARNRQSRRATQHIMVAGSSTTAATAEDTPGKGWVAVKPLNRFCREHRCAVSS